MTEQLLKDETVLMQSICEYLPQGNAYVLDEVVRAADISKKYLKKVKRDYDTEDNMYLHSLRAALKVAKHMKETSNQFTFNYQPIIIALLHDVVEDADCITLQEELSTFRTASNTILNGINLLTNDKKEIEKYGKSKYMVLKFVQLYKESTDLFLVKLCDRLDNLNCLHTIPKTELFQEKPREANLFIKNYILETQNIFNNFLLAEYVIHDSISYVWQELLQFLCDAKV